MKEISLHILDIVQNSIRAKATLIKIEINENIISNQYLIRIIDNGVGMDKETLEKAIDPFYTSRTTRKVGLGLSLFKQNAEQTGGYLTIESTKDFGTTVNVLFKHKHIDRPILGDMAGTISLLVGANPLIDFVYNHNINAFSYCFDSREIKKVLENISVSQPDVIMFIKEMIESNLKEM